MTFRALSPWHFFLCHSSHAVGCAELCVAAPVTGPGDQNSQKPRTRLLLVTARGPLTLWEPKPCGGWKILKLVVTN